MSFRCDLCGKPQQRTKENPEGHRPHQIVTETREFRHESRKEVFRFRNKLRGTIDWLDDPGGIGGQITKEVSACTPCTRKWQADEARLQEQLEQHPVPRPGFVRRVA